MMGNAPQCENGYTRIANELLEAMMRADLSGREWKIVMAIARKTYGYGKKSDQISYGQIARMTGIGRRHVIGVCNALQEKKIISAARGTSRLNKFAIQKDYSQWKDSAVRGTRDAAIVPSGAPLIVPSTAPTKERKKASPSEKPKTASHCRPHEKHHPDPRVKRLHEYFLSRYREVFGSPYVPAYARDRKLLKGILASLQGMNGDSETHVRAKIDVFLSPDHKFKGNVNIPSFFTAFNRLILKTPKTGPPQPEIMREPPPTPEERERNRRRAQKAVREVLGKLGGMSESRQKDKKSGG